MRSALVSDRRQVREVVGRALKIDPARLDPMRPLTCYGLDSLNALELVADLEDCFGRRLPDWLLFGHSTLAALSDVLCDGAEGGDSELALMHADSRLADEIRPSLHGTPLESPRHVLLTGATGFLGASLLRAILEQAGVHVTCLVRNAGGRTRVRQNLDRYGLWRDDLASRFDVACGDLREPALGLGLDRYEDLARSVDAVYHAGADVNWVLGYRALRDTNVQGTIELLRFACTPRAKAFHFISSLSVCYATGGPAVVDEDVDMLPHVDGLPLGYARTKCVAEALVRQAAARGLPARIYRPALLAGDARTGSANLDDLIAVLLKGCIQMGAAPDLDWAFDALPVDCAARAIVALRLGAEGHATIHLKHPRPRHWRECVLWANFFGYRIRLEPFARWRQRLEQDAADPDHALHRLRSFFTRPTADGRTVAELYEEKTRSVVDDDRSRRLQQTAGIDYPALDAGLLNRYFTDYVARGFLPPASRRAAAAPADDSAPSGRGEREIPSILARYFGDETLRVRAIARARAGSGCSIISELMAWRHGQRVGLFHYRLGLQGRVCPSSLDVIVKSKAIDEDVLEVAETTAGMCDERLAREVCRFRDCIGIRDGHRRELAVYELRDDGLKRHMPVCYGTWRDDAGASWGLVLERLHDMALLDAVDDVACWTEVFVAAAIDGLATMHSAWLGRDPELATQPWIGHVATSETAAGMATLWQALANHAAPRFDACAGPGLVATHRRLVGTVPQWWPALEALPRTLIHNDFNSRNIGIRETPAGPHLVAYDWELATVGAPQRDLAELLCFVLPEDASAQTVSMWVERHRVALQHKSGRRLDSRLWRAGFVSALAELLVNRLSFYALVDRVTPQPFLPRVLRTWQRLYGSASHGEDNR